MIKNLKSMTTIFAIATIISVSFLYLLTNSSIEFSSMFGYADETFLMNKQFLYLLAGLVTFVGVSQLKESKWFNSIGAFVFVSSIILLLLMLDVPHSFAPLIDAKKLFIRFGFITLQPIYFFMLGAVWFISYMYEKQTIRSTNLSILILMTFIAFISYFTHDYAGFLLIELVLLSLILYINGISKLVLCTILALTTAIVLFILTSPHRLSRLLSWLHASHPEISKNPLEESSLFFLYNSIGYPALLTIIALFVVFIYFIIKKESSNEGTKLFSIGVVLLIGIDLFLNILATSGYLPVHAPSLFFYSYGLSISMVSFLMIALLSIDTNTKVLKNRMFFVAVAMLLLMGILSLTIHKSVPKDEITIQQLRGKIITDDNVTLATTKQHVYRSSPSGEKRIYTYKDMLTPVIGYNKRLIADKTNYTYLKGMSGLEKVYNEKLQDTPLSKPQDIHLNINYVMQKSLEKELNELKALYDAKEVISVILDNDTFYIKAFASSNRFDPTNIKRQDISNLGVHGIQYLFKLDEFATLVEYTLYLNAKNPKYQIYADLELNKPSGIDLAHERVYKNEDDIGFKNYKVNFMQLVRAFSPFYSGGYIGTPKLVKSEQTNKKQIISKELAQKLHSQSEIFFNTMPGKPVTLEFKDQNLSAAIYMKSFRKENHNYMQAFFTIYNADQNNSALR